MASSAAEVEWSPAPKAPAASILTTERNPVTRYKRPVILAIVAALAGVLAIGFIVAFALKRPDQVKLRDPGAIQMAKPDLKALPTGYSDPRVQRPDLGGPGTAAMPPESADAQLAGGSAATAGPVGGPTSTNAVATAALQRREAIRDAALRQDLAARTAPVFASQAGGQGPQTGNVPLAVDRAAPAPPAGAMPISADDDPNGQSTKQDFIARAGVGSDYLGNRLLPPISPYEVKAGTIIPAALVTALNSDLPGAVVASVTEGVYDHVTGRTLLIPQGARLFGRYDSRISYGQNRALVVWERLIYPDGRSINLAGMSGTDATGAAGLSDRVDNHFGSLVGGVLLSTAISIGAAVADDAANNNNNNLVLQGGAGAVSQDASRTGQQITRRKLDRQPTLKVRPGYRLRVLVNKDIVLAPY